MQPFGSMAGKIRQAKRQWHNPGTAPAAAAAAAATTEPDPFPEAEQPLPTSAPANDVPDLATEPAFEEAFPLADNEATRPDDPFAARADTQPAVVERATGPAATMAQPFVAPQPAPVETAKRAPAGTIVQAAPAPAAPTPGVDAQGQSGPPGSAKLGPKAAGVGKDVYLHQALRMAVDKRASDLHVHSGAPLMLRVDGSLRVVSSGKAMKRSVAERVVGEIMTEAQWAALGTQGSVDFAYELPGVGRFRVNAYRQHRGIDVVFRVIPPQPPTLEQLGLPHQLSRLVDFRTGMVLCTGPAGCGKSTTLAALLNLLIQSRTEHILTIEQPVEFVYPEGKALVNQREVGVHTESFSRALRAALREDPDVITIAELRDRETISLAMSAAETGHLVLGSLHTGNAAQTISRIINTFPAEEQDQMRVMLSESLRAVVSQRLVPQQSGNGRVPAVELLMVNTAVSNIIRDDKAHQLPSVMQTGKAQGMLTMDDSLAELVRSGAISKEDARRRAVKKDRFK